MYVLIRICSGKILWLLRTCWTAPTQRKVDVCDSFSLALAINSASYISPHVHFRHIFLSAGPRMHRYYLCIHEKYVFAATFPTILYYMLPRNIFVQLRERSEIAQLFLGLAISFFIGTHVDPMTDTFSRGHIGVGLKYKFPNFYPHRKKKNVSYLITPVARPRIKYRPNPNRIESLSFKKKNVIIMQYKKSLVLPQNSISPPCWFIFRHLLPVANDYKSPGVFLTIRTSLKIAPTRFDLIFMRKWKWK